ncbi:MAG: isochorismatase family cysteine hydrolase [Actinomycetota bacterium]|nr:isochorismatase family cysteine hydrolase [Actinomycetota bacterium]
MTRDYLTPDFASSVLLTIDMQRDFLDGSPFEIPGTMDVLPNVVHAVSAYRKASLPIVHVVRLYEPGSRDVDPPRRAAVEDGLQMVAPASLGSQLAPGLLETHVELDSGALLGGQLQAVGRAEWIMYKPRWGAFYRTQLGEFLEARGISTVVIAGCNLPNCPRATLVEASERDFRTVLLEDAVSQSSDERLSDLAQIGVSLTQAAAVATRVLMLA